MKYINNNNNILYLFKLCKNCLQKKISNVYVITVYSTFICTKCTQCSVYYTKFPIFLNFIYWQINFELFLLLIYIQYYFTYVLVCNLIYTVYPRGEVAMRNAIGDTKCMSPREKDIVYEGNIYFPSHISYDNYFLTVGILYMYKFKLLVIYYFLIFQVLTFFTYRNRL